jgi:GH24 family phage-related lysozyme (muramidase)
VKISQAGLDLIKSFEGLRLEPYYCSSRVLTIGYGSTGPHVKEGMKITKEEAEKLLLKDVSRFEDGVNKLINIPLTQQQFDALVSFAFNCGIGALEESTLRRRLNSGEDPNTVAREELKRWTNDGLTGLVRRRKAETDLFCSSGSLKSKVIDIRSSQQTWFKKEPIPSSELPNDKLAKVHQGRDYKGCKVLQQKDGHTQLELPGGLGTWWVYDKHFEGLGGVVIERKNENVSKDHISRRLLSVPYQSQRDNYRDASRTCFSSSCAMATMYLKPGLIKDDNEYVRKVFAIGDSTSSSVQVSVLKSLGFKASFKQNGTLEKLKYNIDAGIPVPVGILHKGPATAPSGGGHWICVIGYDDSRKTFTVHDPWGEIDHKSGTYISTNGKSLEYSYNLMKKRWTVEGVGTGWFIDFL